MFGVFGGHSISKQDILDYLIAVLKHWFGLVIALAAGILFVAERLGQSIFGPESQIPSSVWWIVIFLGISMSQFLAWLDIKRERDDLRRYDVTRETLKQVADYRHEQISFQNDEVKDDEAEGAWWTRYQAKRKEIIEFISSNFSPAEASLFESMGMIDIVFLPGDREHDFRYIHRRSMIVRDHRWLDELVKDYGRRRYHARPEEDNDGTR